MIKAKEMRKKVFTSWIDEKWEELEKSDSGRKAFHIGNHIINTATSNEFQRQLVDNGFDVSRIKNSHGVTMIVTEW